MRRGLFGLIILIVLAATLGVVGCTSNSAAELEGKKWLLESYGDADSPTAVIEETRVTAEFSDGQVNGIAGCNNYFGSYEVKGTEITFGPVASTEMYCMDPEGVMDQETAYLSALQSAEKFETDNGTLRITYADGQVLVFNEE
ncbi:MAG TPA: META domain-containing protein [Dehalococcoidia bacterium]|nr:META domain-containing protein [Dehalococcoidia bacterium]